MFSENKSLLEFIRKNKSVLNMQLAVESQSLFLWERAETLSLQSVPFPQETKLTRNWPP